MYITLIQPRSPWGEHPYLPNGLLMVAARCVAFGHTYYIVDENLGDKLDDPKVRSQLLRSDIIGIGALGSPYIPEALRVGQTIRKLGYSQPIAIGGEVIMRLSSQQFSRIYGRLGDVCQITSDEALNALFGSSLLHKIGGGTPTMFNTSMGPVINALSSRMRKAYFAKEWCLFTSQGCAYNCNFCAASKGRKEQFRSPEAFADEVEALVRVVKEIVGARAPYEVYCSSLDGCQTPKEMDRTLRTIAETCKRVGTFFPIRFLATATCTVTAVRHDPALLRRWRGYGLRCIGIGVDGDDPVVWSRENKRHNNSSVIAQSFELIEKAGIQPEAFMVVGFPGDNMRALYRGVRACFRFVAKGITPRPYLGKAHAPGGKGWADGGPAVEQFLDNPALFRELDYGGLASSATHSDSLQRWAANVAFFATTMALKVVSPTGCPTQPLMPTESTPRLLATLGRAWNRFMPQDR